MTSISIRGMRAKGYTASQILDRQEVRPRRLPVPAPTLSRGECAAWACALLGAGAFLVLALVGVW